MYGVDLRYYYTPVPGSGILPEYEYFMGAVDEIGDATMFDEVEHLTHIYGTQPYSNKVYDDGHIAWAGDGIYHTDPAPLWRTLFGHNFYDRTRYIDFPNNRPVFDVRVSSWANTVSELGTNGISGYTYADSSGTYCRYVSTARMVATMTMAEALKWRNDFNEWCEEHSDIVYSADTLIIDPPRKGGIR